MPRLSAWSGTRPSVACLGDQTKTEPLQGTFFSSFGIGSKWEMLSFVIVLIFLLGFPFEWIEICLIVPPVFGPILAKNDFSDHRAATLVRRAGRRNLQTAFTTPPCGATLFCMKG
jgi:TRAP-type mannitol/chloroaromatic compound transport system permease large subunit